MAEEPASPAAVSHLLEELLVQLCGHRGPDALATFAPLDLTYVQIRILMVLAYVKTPTAINQVAERLDISFVSAGRNVDRLVREDLVQRNEDEHDRRVRLVQLTPHGKALVSRHFEDDRKALQAFVLKLSPADRTRLVMAIRPILALNNAM